MADICIDTIPPTITPPEVPEDGAVTKDEILAALGYQEIELTKIDDDGKTVTVYVIGRTEVTDG